MPVYRRLAASRKRPRQAHQSGHERQRQVFIVITVVGSSLSPESLLVRVSHAFPNVTCRRAAEQERVVSIVRAARRSLELMRSGLRATSTSTCSGRRAQD